MNRLTAVAASALRSDGELDEALQQVEMAAKNGLGCVIVPLLTIDTILYLKELGYKISNYECTSNSCKSEISWR